MFAHPLLISAATGCGGNGAAPIQANGQVMANGNNNSNTNRWHKVDTVMCFKASIFQCQKKTTEHSKLPDKGQKGPVHLHDSGAICPSPPLSIQPEQTWSKWVSLFVLTLSISFLTHIVVWYRIVLFFLFFSLTDNVGFSQHPWTLLAEQLTLNNKASNCSLNLCKLAKSFNK